jgi:hypothetical protein
MVNVTSIPVASVTVTPGTLGLQPGQTGQLTATPRDAAGGALSGRTVTWTTTAAGVATVSASGLVTAVAAGSATIRATSEGQVGSAAITVTAAPPVPVASVTVSPGTAALLVGQSAQLTATARDATGTVLPGRVVTWTTSAPGVATVSGTGFVTTHGAGTATVTATSETRTGTATVTVTSPPVGGSTAKAEPVYSAANPDHKLHVEETWANLADIAQIDQQPRSDGGMPWFDRGAKRYGAVVHQPDGFGSVRHVTLDYVRQPPIAPHGTGAHAAGYHWAGAGTATFQGDDNSTGTGPLSGVMNRGFDLIGSDRYRNRPHRDAVVFEFAVRYRGNNYYLGKAVDINSGQTTGIGRFDYDPQGSNLGASADCSDPLCLVYYANGGTSPRFAGLPPHHRFTTPSISRTNQRGNVYFKQNMGFGMAAGQFSWGPGDAIAGPDESNPYPNADLTGTGKRIWEAGWLYNKIRLTRETDGVYGRGRIEMWIGKTPGALTKIMEYFGDVGELAQGLVYIDPAGGTDMLGPIHFYSLIARNYRGGVHVDVGTIRIWSQSRQ